MPFLAFDTLKIKTENANFKLSFNDACLYSDNFYNDILAILPPLKPPFVFFNLKDSNGSPKSPRIWKYMSI